MNENIELTTLSRAESLKYLGYGNHLPGANEGIILDKAEKMIFEAAECRYTYKVFDVNHTEAGEEIVGTSLILTGNSIKEHLKGCDKAVLFAATISKNIDDLITNTGMYDMALSLVLDCMSSVAIEQVGAKFDEIMAKRFEGEYLTFRFGIGYGDLSLIYQPQLLNILEAYKRIGITITPDNIMIPRKSITGIMGISKTPVDKKKRGCSICNMKDICRFRKEGMHCNG